MTETRRPIELLVRLVNGVATGGDLSAWAVDALGADMDSPALRRLAALGPGATLSEAKPLFDRSRLELNLDYPDTPEAIRRAYLKFLADGIAAGELAPLATLETIHREVLSPLNHPDDLMAWCYLDDGLDPQSFESLDTDMVSAKTLALAKAWR